MIFHAFASVFKEQQFLELKRQLLERGEDCLLLGNYNICHYIDYDAIVVTPRDVYVVEFKENHHHAGVITINDNTAWTYADGTRVWAGNHASTVFEQMRIKRNWLYGHMRKRVNPLFIKTFVVFSEPFTLAKGQTVLKNVQEGTHGWLFFDTPERMANTLWEHASCFKNEDWQWYDTLTSYFGMKPQLVGVKWWERVSSLLTRLQKISKRLFGKKYFPYVEQNPVLCLR